MSADVEHPNTPPGGSSVATVGVTSDQSSIEEIGPPTAADGVALWRLVRDTGVLDVNSPYAYLLWCRDFADTSTVARAGDRVVGLITGYRRPRSPDTLFVWQVGVDAGFRGHNLGVRMLYDLADRTGCRWVETTVSPSNAASIAMFTAFARDRGTGIDRSDLFAPEDFDTDAGSSDEHEAEDLYRIGPLPGGT